MQIEAAVSRLELFRDECGHLWDDEVVEAINTLLERRQPMPKSPWVDGPPTLGPGLYVVVTRKDNVPWLMRYPHSAMHPPIIRHYGPIPEPRPTLVPYRMFDCVDVNGQKGTGAYDPNGTQAYPYSIHWEGMGPVIYESLDNFTIKWDDQCST